MGVGVRLRLTRLPLRNLSYRASRRGIRRQRLHERERSGFRIFGSTHAPPADSHCSDSVAPSAAARRACRMALRSGISPSHSPRVDARPHSRTRRLLRGHRFNARGFRRACAGRNASSRLEDPPEKFQRELGSTVPRRRRQSPRRRQPIGVSAARRLQHRHDGRPISRRQRRPYRHLRLARAQRHPRQHRRIGALRSRPVLGRTNPLR